VSAVAESVATDNASVTFYGIVHRQFDSAGEASQLAAQIVAQALAQQLRQAKWRIRLICCGGLNHASLISHVAQP